MGPSKSSHWCPTSQKNVQLRELVVPGCVNWHLYASASEDLLHDNTTDSELCKLTCSAQHSLNFIIDILTEIKQRCCLIHALSQDERRAASCDNGSLCHLRPISTAASRRPTSAGGDNMGAMLFRGQRRLSTRGGDFCDVMKSAGRAFISVGATFVGKTSFHHTGSRTCDLHFHYEIRLR